MPDEKKPALGDVFPFRDVEFRIGASVEGEQGVKAMLVFYIDARAVMNRLDACGCAWADAYTVLPDGKHVECQLTVDGVTRCDVGEPSEGLGDTMKGAYSDAFKRAAVKFGIGRYLYELGETWAPAGKNRKGKVVETGATYNHARSFYVDAVGAAAGDGDRPRGPQEQAESGAPAAASVSSAPSPARPSANGHMTPTAFWKAANDAGYKAPDVRALAHELGLNHMPTVGPADYQRVLDEIKRRKAVAA